MESIIMKRILCALFLLALAVPVAAQDASI